MRIEFRNSSIKEYGVGFDTSFISDFEMQETEKNQKWFTMGYIAPILAQLKRGYKSTIIERSQFLAVVTPSDCFLTGTAHIPSNDSVYSALKERKILDEWGNLEFIINLDEREKRVFLAFLLFERLEYNGTPINKE